MIAAESVTLVMKIPLLIYSFISLVWSKLAPCAIDQGPLPKSVTIVGCDNDEECDFVRGKAVLGDFEFVAPTEISSLGVLIYMTLGKDRNKKAHTDPDADRFYGCDWLIDGYKCPIAKGKSAIWRLNLPIDLFEEISKGAIEIQMRAQDNSTVFCAVVWGNVNPF